MIYIFHSLFLLLLNFLENLPNDCMTPAAVSSRAELHAVMRFVYFRDSIRSYFESAFSLSASFSPWASQSFTTRSFTNSGLTPGM